MVGKISQLATVRKPLIPIASTRVRREVHVGEWRGDMSSDSPRAASSLIFAGGAGDSICDGNRNGEQVKKNNAFEIHQEP